MIILIRRNCLLFVSFWLNPLWRVYARKFENCPFSSPERISLVNRLESIFHVTGINHNSAVTSPPWLSGARFTILLPEKWEGRGIIWVATLRIYISACWTVSIRSVFLLCMCYCAAGKCLTTLGHCALVICWPYDNLLDNNCRRLTDCRSAWWYCHIRVMCCRNSHRSVCVHFLRWRLFADDVHATRFCCIYRRILSDAPTCFGRIFLIGFMLLWLLGFFGIFDFVFGCCPGFMGTLWWTKFLLNAGRCNFNHLSVDTWLVMQLQF